MAPLGFMMTVLFVGLLSVQDASSCLAPPPDGGARQTGPLPLGASLLRVSQELIEVPPWPHLRLAPALGWRLAFRTLDLELLSETRVTRSAFGHRHPEARHVGLFWRVPLARGELVTGMESVDWDADNRFVPRGRGRRLGSSSSLRLRFGQGLRTAGVSAWARLWPVGGKEAWDRDLGLGMDGEASLPLSRAGRLVGLWRGRARLMTTCAGTDLLRIDGALSSPTERIGPDFTLTESVRGFEDDHMNVRALSSLDAELGYAQGTRFRVVIYSSVASLVVSDPQSRSHVLTPLRWATGAQLAIRPFCGRPHFSYQIAQRQMFGPQSSFLHVVALGL